MNQRKFITVMISIFIIFGMLIFPNSPVGAQTGIVMVGSEEQLDAALADPNVSTIQITQSFTVASDKFVTRAVTLILNDNAVTRVATAKWDSVFTLRGGQLTVTGGSSGRIAATDAAGTVGVAVHLDYPQNGLVFPASTLYLYGGNLEGGWNSLVINAQDGNQAFMYGGSIIGKQYGVRVYGNTTDATPINTQFTLVDGTVGSAQTTYAAVALGYGAKLNIKGGHVQATGFAIAGSGNATAAGTEVNISGGVVESAAVAIYHPQNGVLNISGGTISGLEGIEIKAGTLNMSGGTVSATDPTRYDPPKGSSGGSEGAGNAIFIDSRKEYSGAITVNITGGTVTAAANEAVREVNTDGSGLKSTTLLSGGSFFGDPVAVLLAANSSITGGSFNTVPAPLATGYTAYLNAANLYEVGQLCTSHCYVGAGGNDAYPGTPSMPFASIERGVAAVNEGGIVELLDGTFGPVVINRPLTLKGTTAATTPDLAAVQVAASQTPGAWYPDRYPPAVFAGVANYMGRPAIQHGVREADALANRPAAYKTDFYDTQGRKYSFNLSGLVQTMSIDMFVEAAWQTTPNQSAGLWGVGYDAANAVSAYPILTWRNTQDAAPGFYYFDYINGGYKLLRNATEADYGQWHELKFVLTAGVGAEYFIDGVSLGKMADVETVRLLEMILNVSNFGSDYDVYWSNLNAVSQSPAKIVGQVSVAANNVTLEGLDISNPTMQLGVTTTQTVSGLTLRGNTIHDIGNPNVGANLKGFYDSWGSDKITIDGNVFRNIAASPRYSADGVNFGDSTTKDPAENITITNNSFETISSLGKGAYGIKLNNGAGVKNALMQNNSFSNLVGAWTHAIGLETATEGALVLGNSYTGLSTIGGSLDKVAVFFEKNPFTGSVVVKGNQFEPGFAGIAPHPNIQFQYVIDGRENYWGSAAGPALGQYSGDVLLSPWCTNPECTEFGHFPVSMDGSPRAFATLEEMMPFAVDGSSIRVHAPITVANPVTFTKAAALICDEGVKLTVPTTSAGAETANFYMQAAGSSIQNCIIEKPEKKNIVGIIRIAASNVKILNNTISGQWQIGDAEVTRAMVVNAGAFTGLEITGNTIRNLRQPGYVSGTHTGRVCENYVDQTKGWVLEGGNLTFCDNTWGKNVGDIAILATMPEQYYTDILTMSAENNDAVIEDQRLDPRLMSRVYVDASAPAGGNGTLATPYTSLQAGVARLISGGTLIAQPGLYAEQVNITRPGYFYCEANKDVDPVEGGRAGGECTIQGTYAVSISAQDVELNGFEITGFLDAVNAQADVSGLKLVYNWIHQASGGRDGLKLGIGRPADAPQPPVIRNVLVSHNIFSGANKAAVRLSGGDGNAANGIDARYEDLQITQNLFKNGKEYQVFAGATPSDYQVDGFRLNRNIFEGEGFAFNLGNVQPSANLPAELLDNVIKSDGGMIGMRDGTISGNTFTGNATLMLWGAAHGFHRPSENLSIQNNLFQNRETGLDLLVDSEASNSLGYPEAQPPVEPAVDAATLSVITNAFYGTETGAKVANLGLATLAANGNYWGIASGPTADWLDGDISATSWIATYSGLDKQTKPSLWPQSVTETVEPGFWPLNPQSNKFSNPPVVQPVPAQTAYSQEAFSYQVQATDADGDTLSYSLLYAPAGLSIDSKGLISWTPTNAQAMQTYAFFVSVCDASSCVQVPVSINVQMRPKAEPIKLFLPAINR